jgi:hypothetical protein
MKASKAASWGVAQALTPIRSQNAAPQEAPGPARTTTEQQVDSITRLGIRS